MTRFYVLEPDGGLIFGTKWAYAVTVDPSEYGEPEKCPACGGPVTMKKWLPPHRIKLSSAKPEKWGDFVWGAGFPLLVSARFIEIYKQEGLKGIAKFHPPVEIVRLGNRKSGDFPSDLPKYHLIEVPWGGANQDDIASGLTMKFPEKIRCNYCRVGSAVRKQDRIVIEEGSWNGSDIFVARGAPVQFLVSEHFKEVEEKYGINNIWLIPSEKYGYDAVRGGLSSLWYVHE